MNETLKNLTIQKFKNSFEEFKNIFWGDKNKRPKHSGKYKSFLEGIVKK